MNTDHSALIVLHDERNDFICETWDSVSHSCKKCYRECYTECYSEGQLVSVLKWARLFPYSTIYDTHNEVT